MTYMAATEAQYYEYLTSGRTSPRILRQRQAVAGPPDHLSPHLFTFPRKDTLYGAAILYPRSRPRRCHCRRLRGARVDLNFFGLAFPAIQFRLSEALCVLPCRDRKAAIPGLAVGCLITNLLSPYGLLDLVVGTLATLLAAVWSGRCRSAWTAAVPPVVCNMPYSSARCSRGESTGFSAAFAGLFATTRRSASARPPCAPARRAAAARWKSAPSRKNTSKKRRYLRGACANNAVPLAKCPQMC